MAYRFSVISEPITSDPVVDDYLDTLKSESILRSRQVGWKSDMIDLMKHQLQLEWSIRTLKATLQSSTDGDAKRALEAAEDTVATFHSYIVGSLGGRDPAVTAPSAGSSRVAQRVFDVPELAEAILSIVPAKDLLEVACVNRTFASTISTSPKLQRQLGIRPTHDCYWWWNFDSGSHDEYGTEREEYPGFECNVDWEYRRTFDPKKPLDQAKITARCGTAEYPSGWWQSPKVGAQGRSMLICAPPLKQMTVKPSCCSGGGPGSTRTPGKLVPPTPLVITSDTGLTVGDLLDAAADAQEAHRHCAFAGEREHDEETGEVNVRVDFSGFIRLRSGDPALPPSHEPEDLDYQDYYPDYDAYDSYPPSRPEPNPIRDYMEAKRLAVLNDGPVPTFEEFKAANVLDEGGEDGPGQHDGALGHDVGGKHRGIGTDDGNLHAVGGTAQTVIM